MYRLLRKDPSGATPVGVVPPLQPRAPFSPSPSLSLPESTCQQRALTLARPSVRLCQSGPSVIVAGVRNIPLRIPNGRFLDLDRRLAAATP